MGREPAVGRRLRSGCFPREAAVEDMLRSSNISRRGASEKLAELLAAQRNATLPLSAQCFVFSSIPVTSRVGSFRLSSSSYSSRRFSQTASARCTLRGLSRSPLLAASLQIYPKESRLWLGLLGLGAASDFLRGYPTIRPRFSPCLVSSPFS